MLCHASIGGHFASLYIACVAFCCGLHRFGAILLPPALIWCNFVAFCIELGAILHRFSFSVFSGTRQEISRLAKLRRWRRRRHGPPHADSRASRASRPLGGGGIDSVVRLVPASEASSCGAAANSVWTVRACVRARAAPALGLISPVIRP